MSTSPISASHALEIASLRSELVSARKLLDRQSTLLPKLAEAAARAEDRETEAAGLRQQVAARLELTPREHSTCLPTSPA